MIVPKEGIAGQDSSWQDIVDDILSTRLCLLSVCCPFVVLCNTKFVCFEFWCKTKFKLQTYTKVILSSLHIFGRKSTQSCCLDDECCCCLFKVKLLLTFPSIFYQLHLCVWYALTNQTQKQTHIGYKNDNIFAACPRRY